MSSLEEKVKNLPERPGVYIFKDVDGKILYVGKAVSLKRRVRSYFHPDPSGVRGNPRMVQEICDVEYILTSSETEALILESNLIKKYRPKYNIMLRDDKNYPYVKITMKDEWPRVLIARSMKKDGSRYFGPYTSAGALRDTLRLARQIFPLRTCTDSALRNARRPCLNYHIGRCPGPCAGKVSRERYLETVKELAAFLEGRHAGLRENLKRQMEEAADNLQFERAAQLRDRLKALEEISQDQKIVSPKMGDLDVIACARQDDEACILMFKVRDGQVAGWERFFMDMVEGRSDEDIVTAFVKLYYPSSAFIPPEIVLEDASEKKQVLERFLGDLRNGPVRITMPSKGRKKDLLILAKDNARAELEAQAEKIKTDRAILKAATEELQRVLGLPRKPVRIEGYDISNTQGQHAVGSMVVMENGVPRRDQYRKFRIQTVEGIDDFAMMREVIWRRFRRGLADKEEGMSSFASFPDLVVVDGGAGQLAAAMEALRELGVDDVPAIGLAKKHEEIYVPERSEPIVLPRDSKALMFIQRLRDESHRFAVGYHRKLRGREAFRSVLDTIPGIGAKRKSNLLKRFGSIAEMQKASVDELASVPGMNRSIAARLKEELEA